MKNNIAFIFSHPPHGTSIGREGLDLVLATANYSNNIALFFIGDGVLQITLNQDPKKILARDYIRSFKLLSFYEIKTSYVCSDSLYEHGIPLDTKSIISTIILPSDQIRLKLNNFNIILNF
ncbi:MAG: sulfurtransferase complex subunit TusC [Candidatus Dasytiphilus stammeri]